MKKFLKLVLFLIILSTFAIILSACARDDYIDETPTRPQIHGLLSYVEYGGNRAYIFGSMHLGRPYFFPLADIVESAMRRADIFAFEFDLSEMETLENMLLMMQYMFLPAGQTLATYLPPDVYDHLIEILATFPNVNYEDIARMRPMAVSTWITALEIFPVLDIDEAYSVDSYVFSFARENSRPIIGLNPLHHEMSLLFDVPHEVGVAAIASLTDRDTMLAEAYDFGLVEAYIAQDMDALLSMIRGLDYFDDPYSNYMHEVILIQRSIEFAQEIDRLLRETVEPTVFFVTMGIGHMLGDDFGNVFVVLEEMGYEVQLIINN
jgi:uncharacterized protein YbaP (TraB family)